MVADGAESALRLLRQAAAQGQPFRLAVLDQQMPGMDGSELGRQIKADPQLEATVLVMVTSLARRGDAAALEGLGFAGYLTKPVRQAQLHQCLELALERAKGHPPKAGIVTRHVVAESGKPGVRILLAEDNVINQKVAQALLGKLGYRSAVAANGLEVLRALELIRYDLVLMDCQMPEMDGFEATAKLREPGSKVLEPAVPIIAMTANAMAGDRERCEAAGMSDYLAKPVSREALAAVLEKWLAPSAVRGASA